MTTSTRTRRGSSPAYYLGRPAALWLAAYARRPADRTSASCTSEVRGLGRGPRLRRTLRRPAVRDQPVCGCLLPAARSC